VGDSRIHLHPSRAVGGRNFGQGSSQAARIAGEQHGIGVGQELPLDGDGPDDVTPQVGGQQEQIEREPERQEDRKLGQKQKDDYGEAVPGRRSGHGLQSLLDPSEETRMGESIEQGQDDQEEITAVFKNNPSQEKKGFLSRLGFANVSKNITNR